MRYLISLLLCGSLSAATYYVSPTGDGSGTIGSPMSLTSAMAAASAGDTFYLRDGIYSQTLGVTVSGTEASPITWAGYPGETAIIDGGLTRDNCIETPSASVQRWLVFTNLTVQRAWRAGISLLGAENVRFDNLIVRSNGITNVEVIGSTTYYRGRGLFVDTAKDITISGGEYTWNGNRSVSATFAQRGIYLNNNVTNAIVTNAVISFNASDGISWHGNSATTFCRNGQLLNSTITGNRRAGVNTFRTIGLLIQGNTIYSNGSTGIQLETSTIEAYVRGNNVSSNNWNFPSETGIWLDESVYSVIESNRLTGEYRPLYVSQAHTNIWRRNVLWNNNSQLSGVTTAPGVLLAGLGMHANQPLSNHPIPGGGTNNVWAHNTLYRGGVSGVTRGGWYVASDQLIQLNEFQNNIVSHTLGNHEGYCLGNHARMGRVDGNLYYHPSRQLTFYSSTYFTMNWTTWRSNTGHDANSVNADPRFVDIPGLDFSLQADSGAIDRGVWLTTATSTASGTSLPVANTAYFTAGNSTLGVAGDWIQLQGATETARVTGVNHATKTLTLDTSLSWTSGQGVAYPYAGLAPDIGAYEYDATGGGTIPDPPEPPDYPYVSVTATDPLAHESTLTDGTFTLTRTESLTGTLTVDYTITGTATAGTDYVDDLGTSITFADGVGSTNLVVTPLDNGGWFGNQTVILTLADDAAYLLRQPTSATITIIEGDPQPGALTRPPAPGHSPATRRPML